MDFFTSYVLHTSNFNGSSLPQQVKQEEKPTEIEEIFEAHDAKCLISGNYGDEKPKVKLLAGSRFRRSSDKKGEELTDKITKARLWLLETQTAQLIDGQIVLLEDVAEIDGEGLSTSFAADLAYGGSNNGKTYWKTMDGKNVHEVFGTVPAKRIRKNKR